MNAAREKVRVACALADLPLTSEVFRKGQVSYSKVRAMTRIADETNEDYELMIANHGRPLPGRRLRYRGNICIEGGRKRPH